MAAQQSEAYSVANYGVEKAESGDELVEKALVQCGGTVTVQLCCPS